MGDYPSSPDLIDAPLLNQPRYSVERPSCLEGADPLVILAFEEQVKLRCRLTIPRRRRNLIERLVGEQRCAMDVVAYTLVCFGDRAGLERQRGSRVRHILRMT